MAGVYRVTPLAYTMASQTKEDTMEAEIRWEMERLGITRLQATRNAMARRAYAQRLNVERRNGSDRRGQV